MALQNLTGFIYQLVQQSWLVSTVLLKYIIFFTALESYIEAGLSLQHFRQMIIANSRELVTGIIALGFLNVLIGLEFVPYFKVFSQLVALGFFGFLFWKY